MNKHSPLTGAADSISAPHSRGGSAPNAAPLPGAARGLPCRSAEPQSGGAAAPIASNIYGPPTTSRLDGAGGPFNDWDCKIAKAKARGDFKAADELQQVRAKISLAFGILEPVWVPTESQLAIGMMLRVAAVEGVCTLDAVPSDGSTWMRAEAAAVGGR